jgi:hypothetical protein
MAAMEAMLRASIRYIEVNADDTSVDHAAAQTANLVNGFRRSETSIDEATATIAVLNTPQASLVFTVDQRSTLRQAINASYRDGPSLTSTQRAQSKNQKCYTVYNYFPNAVWDTIQNRDIPEDDRILVVLHACMAIQLRYPDEPTRKLVVSMILAAHGGGGTGPADARALYKRMSVLNELVRKRHQHEPLSMVSFPSRVEEYIRWGNTRIVSRSTTIGSHIL